MGTRGIAEGVTERVLLYEEALAEVLRHADALLARAETESLPLLGARGRVLAEDIVADRDQPPFPRSTRDGFAIRSAALGRGALRVLGLIRAGEQWNGAPVGEGEAIEIMTGAPVPEGADCVLMVEHASLEPGGTLRPEPGRVLRPGENVVTTGAEARAGTVLVRAGRRLGVAELGMAASCGYAFLQVFAAPEVAIVATGDELVEVGAEAPAAWQIRNSNSYTLAALVADEGALPQRLPVARDTREDLQARLQEASGAKLLLLSGGVSMGKYDLVEEALREAGAEFFFTGARIQPGKPVVFGRLPRDGGEPLYFFGLPGNPISTEVCFRLFATPLLRALCGRTERAPRFAEARLAEDVRGGAKVTRFLPAVIQGDWQEVTVRPVPWQGSGDLAANARANGFVVLPLGVEAFHAGDTVRVLLR